MGVRRSRNLNSCKARVLLNDVEEIIKGPGEHAHPPKPENVSVERIRSGLWMRTFPLPVAPPNFVQLYAIHGLRHGRNVVGSLCIVAKQNIRYICGNTE